MLSNAEKYAIRYHIIVIAEAIMAMALHIVRRAFEAAPETPTHALRILKDRGVIDQSTYDQLVKIVRLRNLLMHRYWIVNDELIYKNVKEDFTAIWQFIKAIRRFITHE